ncbi:ATP-dependent helicase/nuclease subunit B [Dongia mobilis]|uniref:ATP-dependent helicase/nuclease subunit B n=1 Tax=Dongia mobilis TaxID=578943 RepID=A0A4R6WZZ8_9PROT|nr:double-strand break repair protein AddB [Dongia mobilis]TDQ83437.1 ATP-dependent helicase/nuclease subunit B [Dongia mobilis]
MTLFDRPSRICSIPTGTSFVDALAHGLLVEHAADPLALARVTVLLPNRRACRAMQEAFLRFGAAGEFGLGRPLMLPRLMPLGDLDESEIGLQGLALDLALGDALADELPPAISPLRRQMLLAGPVRRAAERSLGTVMPLEQAVRLAGELARLLDQVETERLDFAAIEAVGPLEGNLAEHWQLTLEFLRILLDHWPAILVEEGATDPARRRNLLLARQARLWRERPPADMVIAAGSTGSIPASADLIATIAALPRGLVVLPGLDLAVEAETWSGIAADPAHPQFGLAQLLERLAAAPGDVWLWPHRPPDTAARAAPASRAAIVSAALLPATATHDWPKIAAGLRQPEGRAQLAWAEVTRIDCQTEQEEAATIALLLREAVTQPAPYRAALVTPDRGLARRVAAELGRWGIVIDDSAGTPLGQTAPGLYFNLIAAALAEELAPVPLLALLKHPLTALGLDHAACQALVRLLERHVLRGVRPGPGMAGLRAAVAAAECADETRQAIVAFIDRLAAALDGLGDWQRDLPIDLRIERHLHCAEALAERPGESGAAALWRGEAGEALAGFVDEWRRAARGLDAVPAASYAALLAELTQAIDVRPRYGLHPRLFIWGPLEARLQQVDLMILGGLNEGIWPGEVPVDPWLSRPMRRAFGLPAPERKIGLAAHDFQQALGAPRVVMTRAQRVGGKPSVPSRWLLRLDAFLRALGIVLPVEGPSLYRGWQARLDRPEAPAVPIARPAPRPGAAYRPSRLSVTEIETWMRDPYALYARHILKLRALDPLDQEPGVADLGSLFHEILDRFLGDVGLPLPPDAEARLIDLGRQHFAEHLARPTAWAFWWPRFLQVAQWFVAEMKEREAGIAAIATETRGRLEIGEVTPPFTLTAKADRLDRLADGSLVLIDYKTGALPKSPDVVLGFASQLPLEAAMALRGAFPGPAVTSVAALEYWHLKGGREGCRTERLKLPNRGGEADPMQLAAEAYAGLVGLVTTYGRDDAAYMAQPRAAFALRYNDYDHLARIAEWASEADE